MLPFVLLNNGTKIKRKIAQVLKIKNTVAKIISENFYLIGHVD